jgi:hypothetical protein
MSIEQRLQRLEKQNRYWMLGTVCLAAFLLLGASRSVSNTTVQAQKFELVDACGKVRAELLMEDGLPALVFTSSTRARCSSIGMYRDPGLGEGGRVLLCNANTNCSIALQTGMDSALLSLIARQNRCINIQARSLNDQKPVIWMTDDTGVRAQLSTTPARGLLQLTDTNGGRTFTAP